MKSYWEEQKWFKYLICTRIIVLFSDLNQNLKSYEVTKLHEFNLLLLSMSFKYYKKKHDYYIPKVRFSNPNQKKTSAFVIFFCKQVASFPNMSQQNLKTVPFSFSLVIQGYPKRKRLQRRLYEISTFCFLIYTVPCNCKLVPFCAKSL